MNTKDNEKKLFLLDAYALIFRAYYAFIKNPRYNSKGLNTSAILGFTNTLNEILSKEQPDYIGVAFDPPGPTFRNTMYEEYKANRDETPEDIKKSVPYIKEILRAFRIPVIEVENFEADDTIGTLAKKAEKEGFTVYMVTPDKDYGQLVSENIYMLKPKRGNKEQELLGKKEICELYNIERPEQVIDILAIWGDTSDNIPGIPGVGQKTSKKLIAKYGSAEGLLQNSHKLKGKQKENVENSKDLIALSKKLVTIKTDVPVEFNSKDYLLESIDEKLLLEIFDDLEFKTLAKRLIPEKAKEVSKKSVQTSLFGDDDATQGQTTALGSSYQTYNAEKQNYTACESPYEIEELVKKLASSKAFCFDTETSSANPHKAKLVGIAFAYRENEAFYVPLPEDEETVRDILSILAPVFENEKIQKIGQNIKYDLIVMSNYGQKVNGPLFDTMIAHYLIDADSKHNLTALAEQYLNYTPIEIESLIGKKASDGAMRKVPIEKITAYACEDADICFKLKGVLEKKLAESNMSKLAEEIEFPLIPVLVNMEKNGVKIDLQKLKDYEKQLINEIEATQKKIYELAGTEFNIASPKQLGTILFEKLKISDKPKLTKTKQYATGERELLKLESEHEIISHILDYRSNSKLLSTYVRALPKLISEDTEKLHTTYNQAVVSTGRLSSTNPNLQNIPVRTPEGKKIRESFVPENTNNILIAADYSQIELRLMAHLSQDDNMLEAFKSGEDIHTITASKIFKKDASEVTGEMRSQAKSANFGIIYGISAFGLSENLKIPRSEAKQLIEGYFETYPQVKKYMDKAIHEGREKKYATTLFGRKRKLHNIDSNNSLLRSNDERNAINAPLQGSASDIIKKAMISTQKRIREEGLQSKMILQVHDELVFDVPKNERAKLKEIALQEMEHAVNLSVDLKVDIGEGDNWLEAH
jgi:DNA polymerase I